MLRFRGFQKPIFAEREEITHNSLKIWEIGKHQIWISSSGNLGQGVHRKPMATHKTVTFVTSNTLLYFTAFTKTTTLFRIFNMKYLIQYWGSFRDLASWEVFRQMWILCNSAAKGFFYQPSFPPHQNFNSTSNWRKSTFYMR